MTFFFYGKKDCFVHEFAIAFRENLHYNNIVHYPQFIMIFKKTLIVRIEVFYMKII